MARILGETSETAHVAPALRSVLYGAWINRRPAYLGIKRALDILLAGIALGALGPLILVLAVLVKLSTPGPAFFGHERLGRGGTAFRCWKLRTMHESPSRELDPNLVELFEQNFKLREDPRVTRLGRLLRRSSLDELPQLWNVLRGDMSIVGPRPMVQREIDRMYGVSAAIVFKVRPGLTGLWQVSRNSGTTYAERIALDIAYVERMSLGLDLWILVRTPHAVLTASGAY